MTDQEYDDRADQLLMSVEQSVDAINDSTDADMDGQRSGGMITLVFADGSQIIVNQQKPLHEIWMAARSGGYHYRFDGSSWQDTKGGGEFFAALSRDATAQSHLALTFAA